MTEIIPAAPLAPPPAPLIAVDRAVAELRRGGIVVVTASGHVPMLVEAAEALGPQGPSRLIHLSGTTPRLIITGRRARVLGLDVGSALAVALTLPGGLDDMAVAMLADPNAGAAEQADLPPPHLPEGATATPVPAGDSAEACVILAKLARLLPAVVTADLTVDNCRAWAAERNILTVDAAAVRGYHETAARSLRMVGTARVPLESAEVTRILAFRPSDGGIEHLAILIGEPDPEQPVLTRLHSECFTGDLLGSLRCDCGDQLRGAIDAIAAAGSGVLLYLAQEGRGIGLVNKLRAYQLQDAGFDTLDANGQLGFDDDERLYLPAAEMLRQLGFTRVRLMTNNPLKVDALARHGVVVEERVPHIFTPNPHNLSYLRTKAIKGGHLF